MINKTMACVFLIGCFLVTQAYGIISIGEFKEKHANKPLKLPKKQIFSGQMHSGSGILNLQYNFSMSVSPTSNLIITEVKSQKTKSRLIADANFNPIREEFYVYGDDMSKIFPYQNRIGTINKNKIMQFKFKTEESHYIKTAQYSNNTMDSFLVIPTIQNYLHYGLRDFTCEFIVQDSGLRADLKFEYGTSDNLNNISPQYDLPKFVTKFKKLNEPVIVYKASVIGLFGLFYKHKRYYLFQLMPPHKYIGTWGGPKEKFILDFSAENLLN